MASCSYCGKAIPENSILQVGDKSFCNNLCRHSFEQNGTKAKQGVLPSEAKPAKTPKNKAAMISAGLAAIAAIIAGQLTTGFMKKDHAGLKEYVSPDKSFTIMLPKAVKESKHSLNTQIGTIDAFTYSATAKHQEFSVSYSAYPDSFIAAADPKQLLDGSREGAVGNIQGKLLSEEFIDLNGSPGRELKIEGPQKLILRCRLYLVGKRLYQLIVVSKPDHAYDKKIGEVFDSFKIKGEE